MIDHATVTVTGLRELQKSLGDAGPTLMKRAIIRALDAGAEVFVDGAKARCPVLAEETAARRPGALRDSIKEFTTVDTRRQTGRVRVGPEYSGLGSQDPGVYGLFVEYGAKHMKAEPFMRPAYDAGTQQAVSVFADEIRKGLDDLKHR
jgi:HK97 gp10 family phage protein